MRVPELYELEYLFECEAICDEQESIPWFFKRVSFALLRGQQRVELDLEVASGTGELRLYSDDAAVIQLSLEAIVELARRHEGGVEAVVIEFGANNSALLLYPQPSQR